MTAKQIENFCKENGASYKPYPIKLAYEASSRISIKALKALLKGLYEVILDSRTSKGDMWRFRDLCLTYLAVIPAARHSLTNNWSRNCPSIYPMARSISL